MSTDLEKWLGENRQRLDVEKPDDELIWEGIRSGLGKEPDEERRVPPGSVLRSVMRIAAVVLLALSLSYAGYDLLINGKPSHQVTLSDIDPGLGKVEKEYIHQVKMKTRDAHNQSVTGNKVIIQLFEELKELDSNYAELSDDLGQLGNDERVVSSIFDYYERKIKLLELIILESNKIREHENNSEISM